MPGCLASAQWCGAGSWFAPTRRSLIFTMRSKLLQIAFGWSDSHLNSFRIQGKDYGVHHIGGPLFNEDANTVAVIDGQD